MSRSRPVWRVGPTVALGVCALWHAVALCEQVFVNDRLEVGLHQDATRQSAILELIPSGAALEVLERDGRLARVRTEEGAQGWVDSRYLTDRAPETALVDAARREVEAVAAERDEARAESRALGERLTEAVSEMESMRLDLAAARAAQAEAQAALAERGDEQAGPTPEESLALSQALRDVQRMAEDNQRLKQELADLETMRELRGEAPAPNPAAQPAMQAPSIETPGSPREVVNLLSFLGWEPWQWMLLVSILLLAFGAGGYVVDLGVRRRHGGFRV